MNVDIPTPATRVRQKTSAAAAGFDWPDYSAGAGKTGAQAATGDELGERMFVCVNMARHCQLNAETALRESRQKFSHRFGYVLEQMHAAGQVMDRHQRVRMERSWQESKSVVG